MPAHGCGNGGSTTDAVTGLIDAHRLVALFFGAMGINEHASVRVKNL